MRGGHLTQENIKKFNHFKGLVASEESKSDTIRLVRGESAQGLAAGVAVDACVGVGVGGVGGVIVGVGVGVWTHSAEYGAGARARYVYTGARVVDVTSETR